MTNTEAKPKYPFEIEFVSKEVFPVVFPDNYYRWTIDKENNRVFIKTTKGFCIINCSNPYKPYMENNYVYSEDTFIHYMKYCDGFLYLKIGNINIDETLQIFDVSKSSEIICVGTIFDYRLHGTKELYLGIDKDLLIHIGRYYMTFIKITDYENITIENEIRYKQFDGSPFGDKNPYCTGLALHPTEKYIMFAIYNFNGYSGNAVFMYDYSDVRNLTRIDYQYPEESYFEYYGNIGPRIISNGKYPIIKRTTAFEVINWENLLQPIIEGRFIHPIDVEQIAFNLEKKLVVAYSKKNSGITSLFNYTDYDNPKYLAEPKVDSEGIQSLFAPYINSNYIYCLDVVELQTTCKPLTIWKISTKENRKELYSLLSLLVIPIIAIPAIIKKKK